MKRFAFVLAGGSGERFWPLSRRDKPKQFLSILQGGPSLLEQAIARIEPIADEVRVVTSERLVGTTIELGVRRNQISAEPAKRNTAGAIAWAMAQLPEDSLAGFFPADHVIGGDQEFCTAVGDAYDAAAGTQSLLTIGVVPSRPETGYGYIECGSVSDDDGPVPVARFHEKPDEPTAIEYMGSGTFLWNSGMFFWTVGAFENELQKAEPDYFQRYMNVRTALSRGDLASARAEFESLPSISIDHLLMERSNSISVIRGAFEWDDVGSLDSLARWLPPGSEGARWEGDVVTIDSDGCLLINRSETQMLAVLGISDLVVVSTPDAILVCPKDRAQDIRKLVAELERRGSDRI